VDLYLFPIERKKKEEEKNGEGGKWLREREKRYPNVHKSFENTKAIGGEDDVSSGLGRQDGCLNHL
jgi:hypothetical protein